LQNCNVFRFTSTIQINNNGYIGKKKKISTVQIENLRKKKKKFSIIQIKNTRPRRPKREKGEREREREPDEEDEK
jgi:hypothetical protein